jgi:cell division septation protein DedD
LFNAVVGVLILGIAAALFWPRGGGDSASDSLVLTPEDLSAADSTAMPLQASVDTAPITSSPEDVNSSSFAETSDQDASLQDPAPSLTSAPTQTIRQPSQSSGSSIQPGTTGRFYLVVGSYAESANASREVRRLSSAGIAASSVPASTADGSVHRIHVGYFQSQADAEAYGRKLKQTMGLDYWVGTR